MRILFLTVYCCLSWGAAYALTFVTKWISAAAVTGKSISDTALSAAGERIGELPEGIGSGAELFFASLGSNLSMLTPSGTKISPAGIFVWILVFTVACVFIAVRDSRKRTAPHAALIIIALLPFLRFGVLMNHSYLHNYFTYRAFMASIMAVLGMVWYKEQMPRKETGTKTAKNEKSGKKTKKK